MPYWSGLLPFVAGVGAGPFLAQGCLGLSLACFGCLLALGSLGFGAAAPILALLASLAILPGPGPGFCFLAFAPLGFLPFCFGRCGRAWPSGGGFVCAATFGCWLPFVFVALLVGVWLVVAPVVTSRDASLF